MRRAILGLGIVAIVVAVVPARADEDGDRYEEMIEKVLHRLELLEERVARMQKGGKREGDNRKKLKAVGDQTIKGVEYLMDRAQAGDANAREYLMHVRHKIDQAIRHAEDRRGDVDRKRVEMEHRRRDVDAHRKEMEQRRRHMEERERPVRRRERDGPPEHAERRLEEMEGLIERLERQLRAAREEFDRARRR